MREKGSLSHKGKVPKTFYRAGSVLAPQHPAGYAEPCQQKLMTLQTVVKVDAKRISFPQGKVEKLSFDIA